MDHGGISPDVFYPAGSYIGIPLGVHEFRDSVEEFPKAFFRIGERVGLSDSAGLSRLTLRRIDG